MDTQLEARFTEVRQRIADAAARAGRTGDQVDQIILVAVTKFAEPDQIRALIDMGHADFGENKVQNLLDRASMVDEFLTRRKVLPKVRARRSPLDSAADPGAGNSDTPGVRWHMIGHLQRNKARKAVDVCRLIQTVDSLRLAEELQAIGLKRDRDIEVLLQVNCSGEQQKFGIPPPAARALAEQIDSMSYLHLRGVMTIAEATESPEDARFTFSQCRDVFEDIRKADIDADRCNILSMGMSGDYEVASEEGANVVRVGSAIFGSPAPSGSDTPDSAAVESASN